jgi:type IV pilus assembly protein PilQ
MRYFKHITRCIIVTAALFVCYSNVLAQDRFALLDAKLNQLANESPGLYAKVDLSVNMVSIQDFIRGIATTDSLNVTVDPTLNVQVINNFSNVLVKDVFIFLCKKYNLDITFTGSIMSFIEYKELEKIRVYEPKELKASYDKANDQLSVDFKNDSLPAVTKKLTEITGANIVYAPDLNRNLITIYLQNIPLKDAMDKIAFANGLKITSPDDNSFQIERNEPVMTSGIPSSIGGKVDSRQSSIPDLGQGLNVRKLNNDEVFVDAVNAPIAKIIEMVSSALKKNYYLYSDIKGNATINVAEASYEELLMSLLKGTDYTFRSENGIYFIGDRAQEGLRTTCLYQFKFRTVDKVIDVIPADLKKGIDIKPFTDLNSLILCGSEPRINELKKFLNDIDRVVPVILIEVMIVDVSNTKTLTTGIQSGLGTAPTATSGTVFPSLNMTLGAGAINNIINGINGMGLINLGNVTPNFYMNLQAMDQQGIVKIKSTPKLATINGREANMSIGTTEYYLETQNTVVGTQNPQNITTEQYKSVDADLSVKINPIVSGDEQITMDISVKQTDFTTRISPSAPPGSTTRNFQSVIRVKNGDMIILGGLEDNSTNESGTGVPFLSRIPILKWFFSSRTRAVSKDKLTIFIRPTIIY